VEDVKARGGIADNAALVTLPRAGLLGVAPDGERPQEGWPWPCDSSWCTWVTRNRLETAMLSWLWADLVLPDVTADIWGRL